METFAIMIIVLCGLGGLYCGLMMAILSKAQVYMKVLMDAGMEYFPRPIADYLINHPHSSRYMHQAIKFNKMMKEFIEKNIEE